MNDMPPITDTRERNLYRIFEVGVVLKGANALLEIVLGILLFFVNVGDIVLALVQNELVEDPNDFLAAHLQPYATHLAQSSQTFPALYLLSHGLIKIVLVWGLLRRKLWAYPASLAVLTLFVVYQVIQWLDTHSVALLLLTVFDLTLMWLVYHEYRRMSRRR
jgi:uncharacterized membrane protein